MSDRVLNGILSDYYDTQNQDLLDRWLPHQDWWDERLALGVDPYCKTTEAGVGTRISATYRGGGPLTGVNFASQDYLNLSNHPRIIERMVEAAETFGVHSAGSAALMGITRVSADLEQAIADFLGLGDCTLFSTGWGAGYGIVKLLVRETDHVVIDILAHACLQEGARNATKNVSAFPHISTEAVERRLRRIRESDKHNGILVVTESVFSMDSDVPEILKIQELCRQYGATMVLDVAHDLGSVGPTGRGYPELQGAVGRVDVVMGSFSKTFASNGGFVASQHRGLKQALRSSCNTQTFTNAMSPVGAAVVLEALRIVRSEEGAERRQRLMANIIRLRAGLVQAGFEVLGRPSPIVPIVLGDNAQSRLITKRTMELGALVNLVEYPAVSRNSCRWRLQVMAEHTSDDIDAMVRIAAQSRDEHSTGSIVS